MKSITVQITYVNHAVDHKVRVLEEFTESSHYGLICGPRIIDGIVYRVMSVVFNVEDQKLYISYYTHPDFNGVQ